MMEEITELPLLSPEEIRVLGSLLEKSKTTPEYYPMTLNGLLTACNQKSSRKPVVQYDENLVLTILDQLRKKGIISTVVGGGSRVTKYKHNLAIKFPLLPQELAILCLLFLRGPLTIGEIKNNSARLFDFESLNEIKIILDKLSDDTPAYVRELPKAPGQKETRYIHLFTFLTEEQIAELNNGTDNGILSSNSNKELEQRVTLLENQLLELRTEFDKLMKELT